MGNAAGKDADRFEFLGPEAFFLNMALPRYVPAQGIYLYCIVGMHNISVNFYWRNPAILVHIVNQ